MPNRINKTWHENNVMPKNATMEFRIKWHVEHQAQCACREIPAAVRAAMEGISTPKRATKQKQ